MWLFVQLVLQNSPCFRILHHYQLYSYVFSETQPEELTSTEVCTHFHVSSIFFESILSNSHRGNMSIYFAV